MELILRCLTPYIVPSLIILYPSFKLMRLLPSVDEPKRRASVRTILYICLSYFLCNRFEFICTQTIERILASVWLMWIYGLGAQTESNQEGMLRQLSCELVQSLLESGIITSKKSIEMIVMSQDAFSDYTKSQNLCSNLWVWSWYTFWVAFCLCLQTIGVYLFFRWSTGS